MSVVVIGAGQAGLAVSRELSALGLEHVVLERGKVGQAWRDRWDSFTLVTPNWTLALPGHPYSGPDPEGHVPREDIVSYLDGYARSLGGQIAEGVEVTRLTVPALGGSASSNSSTTFCGIVASTIRSSRSEPAIITTFDPSSASDRIG